MHSTCNHFKHCIHCMVSSAAEYPLPDSPHPSQSTSLGKNPGVFCCKWHRGERRDADGAKVDNVAMDPGDGCEIAMLACDGNRDKGLNSVTARLEDDSEIATPSADGASSDDKAMGSGDCCEIVTIACGGDKEGRADSTVKGLGEADGASPDDVAMDSGDGCEMVKLVCGGGDEEGDADGAVEGLVKGLGDEADGAAIRLEDDCKIMMPSADGASLDDVAMDSGDGCEMVKLACGGGDKEGDADGAAKGLGDGCGIAMPSCNGGRDSCGSDEDADRVFLSFASIFLEALRLRDVPSME